MTLYFIGLGLDNEITNKARQYIEECDKLYLDDYTSYNNTKLDKPIIKASRELLESNSLIEEAKTKNIGLLIIGDVFIATTHYSLYLEVLKQKIKVKVAHGLSILNYISELGLFQYKFGAIASIPFDDNITSYYEILKKNLENGWHTLLLLDLKEGKFMDVEQAITKLINLGLNKSQLVIAYNYNGKNNVLIGRADGLKNKKLNNYPVCLIIPGKLHFMEEEALKLWK